VSCGTAVTIDLLSAAGEFVGGVILPGLDLQRRALFAGTAGIPEDSGSAASCFGRTTADAVAAGTRCAVVGAIERAYEEAMRELGPDLRLFLSGGAAPALLPYLRIVARHEPALVLQGLARIAAQRVGA